MLILTEGVSQAAVASNTVLVPRFQPPAPWPSSPQSALPVPLTSWQREDLSRIRFNLQINNSKCILLRAITGCRRRSLLLVFKPFLCLQGQKKIKLAGIRITHSNGSNSKQTLISWNLSSFQVICIPSLSYLGFGRYRKIVCWVDQLSRRTPR